MEHGRSIFQNHPHHQKSRSAVYRGIGHIPGAPIVGKLSFGSAPSSGSARIAVLLGDTTAERARALCEEPSTVALLFVGEALPTALKEAASEHALPLLVLDTLPLSHDGEIAILDSTEGLLLVHPNLEALSRYASRGQDATASPLPPPLTDAYPTVTSAEPAYLLPPLEDEPSEEALFERYRDAAEAAAPHRLFITLSAKEEQDAQTAHLCALLRAAVFGNVTLLWSHMTSKKAWENAASHLSEAERVLGHADREYRADIPVGLLLSAPFQLFALPTFPTVAHVCLNLPRLLPATLGIAPDEVPDADALSAFWELLPLCLEKRNREYSAVLPTKLERIDWITPLLPLGISTHFHANAKNADNFFDFFQKIY